MYIYIYILFVSLKSTHINSTKCHLLLTCHHFIFPVIFSLLGVIIYVVLFQTNFANNVLSREDYQTQTFRTKGHTSLDYSFYFTVGSLAGYLFNLLLMMCSGYKLRCVCTQEADKAIDNGIILY